MQAGANALDLDSISSAQKPYQLILRRTQLDLPPVQMLIKTLGRASFHRKVGACIGYDMRTAGDCLA
jgi:molybdate-binding protein